MKYSCLSSLTACAHLQQTKIKSWNAKGAPNSGSNKISYPGLVETPSVASSPDHSHPPPNNNDSVSSLPPLQPYLARLVTSISKYNNHFLTHSVLTNYATGLLYVEYYA